jgi:tRNA pseudouridine55 synthase
MTDAIRPSLDGVLLIDKPSGPTSHDVVARLRRVLGERRIGHTGTLDPMASGLLPLVVGRATRLVPLLIGSDKTYDATICLGIVTDSCDALGKPLGPPRQNLPSDQAIDAAIERFRGAFDQRPPAHSAKWIDGTRAYTLARKEISVEMAPVRVTVRSLEVRERREASLDLRVTATAGFYVRSLARDLGEALGCGGHLSALRRLRSGFFDLSDAVPLADAEAAGAAMAGRLLDPASALPGHASVTVNDLGLKRALHGNWLGPQHLATPWHAAKGHQVEDLVKILAQDRTLIALAKSKDGTLHPVVVLG